MREASMKVTLVSFTQNSEVVISSAARLCYAKDTMDIFKNDESVNAFITKLFKMGHLSPFEHASFTFLVEGISQAAFHQFVVHNSQCSQRWINHDNFDYIVPPSIAEANPHVRARFNIAVKVCKQVYRMLVKEGIPKEDARFVLPNACETKILVTMNARELFHFFSQRLCNRAQWEIRQVAEVMLYLCRLVAPIVFQNIGLHCVIEGHCIEGGMSCGKEKEVKEKYAKGIFSDSIKNSAFLLHS